MPFSTFLRYRNYSLSRISLYTYRTSVPKGGCTDAYGANWIVESCTVLDLKFWNTNFYLICSIKRYYFLRTRVIY